MDCKEIKKNQRTQKRKQSSREERRSNGEKGGKKALLEWVYIEIYGVFKKDEREEVEKKLLNEEIIQYYCCYHLCGLIPELFHYLTKKKPNLQIAILENIYQFLVFLRKMKVKKLPNEYEPLFIPKRL